MKTTKKYWKSLAQLNDDPIVEKLAQNEFAEELPVDQFLGDKENLSASNSSRRDFLKFLGFSTAAATLAACETPVVKSIPYLVKPDEIMPGVANYYASTYYDGRDYASILVKTREGRPIKIENIIGLRTMFFINAVNRIFFLVVSSKKKAITDNKITPSINIILVT